MLGSVIIRYYTLDNCNLEDVILQRRLGIIDTHINKTDLLQERFLVTLPLLGQYEYWTHDRIKTITTFYEPAKRL